AVRYARRAAERPAAVGALEPAFVADVDDVGVGRVDSERREVERAGNEVALTVHERPGGAGVLGAVETGAGLGLDKSENALGPNIRNGDVAASEKVVGEAPGELRPVLAAVGGFVDAAFFGSADDGPGLALAVPHGGE